MLPFIKSASVGGRTVPTILLAGVLVAGLAFMAVRHGATVDVIPEDLVCAEHFTPDWTSRWRVDEGAVAVESGQATTTANGATILRLNRRLEAPFSIEYIGKIAQDAPPGDISLILWRDPGLAKDGSISDSGMRLIIQLGAYEGSYSAIMHADARRFEQVTANPFRPLPGHSYRIRVTVIDQDLRVYVDDQEIMRHHDPLPLTGVYAGLFGYYPGKSFADVQVRCRQRILQLPPTAVGDAFLVTGDAQRALSTYESIVAASSGTLLTEARYKQGLALRQLDRIADARGAWLLAGQDANAWAGVSRLAFLDVWAIEGTGGVGSNELERTWQDPAMRPLVEQAWSRWIYRAADLADSASVDRWLAVRERLFPTSFATEHVAADALMMTRRTRQVTERFPLQDRLAAVAFLRLGEPSAVLARYPQQRGAAAEALLALGRGADVHRLYPEQVRWTRLHQLRSGDANRLADEPDTEAGALAGLWRDGPAGVFERANERVRIHAAGHAGHWEEVLSANGSDAGDRAAALISQGRPVLDQPWALWAAMTSLDPAAEPVAEEDARGDMRLARARWLLWPALHPGAPVPGNRDTDFLGQRPGVWIARLLGTDTALPDLRFAEADAVLIEAVRADRVGNTALAIAGYRAWLALPSWRRDETTDPLAEAVIKQRLADMNSGSL